MKGKPFPADSAEWVAQLGLLMAKLHQQTSQWDGASRLIRPFYDAAHFSRIVELLKPGRKQASSNRPIDFSLCGFGHYLFDVATCLGCLEVKFRRPFLDSYDTLQPLSADHIHRIETFFLASRFSYYAFVLPNVAQQEWLKHRIPQVVEALCQPFLSGQSFLFDFR